MPPKGWRKDAQGNYPTTSYVKEQENITIQDLLFPRSTVIQLAKAMYENTNPNNTDVSAENENAVMAGDDDLNLDDEGGDNSNGKLLVNKDAALALQRSATVFVNHLLLFARELSKEEYRKSCSQDDILNALEAIGYPDLKNIVYERLMNYQNALAIKKEYRKAHPSTMPSRFGRPKANQDEDSDEESDEEVREGGAEHDAHVNKKQQIISHITESMPQEMAIANSNPSSMDPIHQRQQEINFQNSVPPSEAPYQQQQQSETNRINQNEQDVDMTSTPQQQNMPEGNIPNGTS